MRKTILLALMLSGLGLADPKLAMVLKVEGAVQNNASPVLTGQMWAAGDHVEMPAGSKVTVLLLQKGERLEVSGQGSVDVSAGGLALKGACRSKALPSNQVRLALSGENQRQIGGMVTRGEFTTVFNSVLDRVTVSSEGVTVSRPAAAGAPPKLKFFYLDQFAAPLLAPDWKSVKLGVSGPPAKSVLSLEVAGKRVGARWQWQVPWPLEEAPRNYALQVLAAGSNSLQLYTRLYRPGPEELSDVASSRQQVAQWAHREPGTVGPWLYLANLLEEKGLLEQSLQALQPALALQPHDRGLLEMKARLLLDLGRYRQAAQVLEPR